MGELSLTVSMYSALKTITLTYVTFIVYSGVRAADPECFERIDSFEKRCAGIEGTRVGGQCFFVAGLIKDDAWAQGWGECEKRGAVLAQLHTETEYNTVVSYLQQYVQRKYGTDGRFTLVLTGLCDPEATNKNGNAIQRNTTLWYSSETATNGTIRIAAGDTWIRTHENDDVDSDHVINPRCFHLSNSFQKLTDNTCNRPALALCQLTNRNQNFTRTEFCLQETPIDELHVMVPEDCAKECARTPWCRSFNFLPPSKNDCKSVCQLFTWSTRDKCSDCAKRTEASGACYHFTSAS